MREFDELAQELIQDRRDSELKLTDFTPIADAPNTPIWQTIRALYRATNLADKVKGTILNGVETSRKSRFLLSRTILAEYINEDPNVDRVGLNGNEHKDVMKRLAGTLNGALIRCIIKPSSGRPRHDQPAKAGTYVISHPKVIQRLEWWAESSVLPYSLPDKPTPEVEVETESDNEIENAALENRVSIDLTTFKLSRRLPDGFEAFTETKGLAPGQIWDAPDKALIEMLRTFREEVAS